jgi:succinoglycan biosynthesis protein ExoM
VATFKRPEMLAILLRSLSRQKLEGIQMKIIVVDNDRGQSARDIVESFSREAGGEVVYDVEPTQGISYSRNRALDHWTMWRPNISLFWTTMSRRMKIG